MKVAVTWQMSGYVDIPADTMEKAMPGIVSSQVLYDPLQFYRS